MKARTTATILTVMGLIIAASAIAVTQYDYSHPVSPPQVKAFKINAFLSNEESAVVDMENCNVTNPPLTVEDWIFGLNATVEIIIQNTGNTPLFISSLDIYNNYTRVTWTASVPLIYGAPNATIPTGTIRIYGVLIPTSNWDTNSVVNLHFTLTTSDGDTNSTNLLLQSIFRMPDSTTTSFSTTTTTSTVSTTSSGLTYSCPISVGVP